MACPSYLYSMNINPRPFTLLGASSKLIIWWGLGIIMLTTSPNLFAISLTSYSISSYSSSIANYSIDTIYFNTTILLGGHTILSSMGGILVDPSAATFFKIVSIFRSVPIYDSKVLLYSMYCLGRPSFSWYPKREAPLSVSPFVAYCADLNSTNA